MRVDSENPVVRDRVSLIADTVRAQGGYIHPELVVHQQGASLWLSVPRAVNSHLVDGEDLPLTAPHPQAEPLLIIPDALYIPVTDLDWEPHDTVLRYRGTTDHLSQAQLTILNAMVDLFNAVDKVKEVGQNYPTTNLRGDRELLEKLREARPRMGLGEDGIDDRAPSIQVMKSRLRTIMGEGEEGPIGFFMPMIDMLDHHPFGSRYRRMDDDTWRIDLHHPDDTDKVFVRYHQADVLGTAIGLGYVERATRHVSSVACTVEEPLLGHVRVRGVSAVRKRIQAPRVTKVDDGWEIAGLVFEPTRITTLRTLLGMPIRAAHPSAESQQIDAAACGIIGRLVAANATYFNELRDLCRAPVADGGGNPRLRSMFADVSDHQLALLADVQRALDAECGQLGTG